MFLFFSFFSVSVKLSSMKVGIPGFYSLDLEEGSHFSLNLINKTAFFIGNLKHSTNFKLNQHHYNFPYHEKFTEIGGQNLTVDITKNTTLSFWIIDSNSCKHAVYLQSPGLLHTDLTYIPDSTCFFPQLEYGEGTVEITHYSEVNISFFNSLTLSKPIKTCYNTGPCKLTTNQHYYLQINNKNNKTFSIDYSVTQPSVSDMKCLAHSSDNFVHFENVKCSEIKEVWFNNQIISAVVIFIIFLAVIYKLFGHLLCPSNEALLFDNLKKDPYATPLEKPNEQFDYNLSSSSVV